MVQLGGALLEYVESSECQLIMEIKCNIILGDKLGEKLGRDNWGESGRESRRESGREFWRD